MRSTSIEMIYSSPYESNETILRVSLTVPAPLSEWDIVLMLLKHFTIVWDGRRADPIVNKDAR
jgi:hypothetical protein